MPFPLSLSVFEIKTDENFHNYVLRSFPNMFVFRLFYSNSNMVFKFELNSERILCYFYLDFVMCT
jgi:hypothetical protein